MILIKIDRESATPIYQQIVQELIRLIENGALEHGARLPSSR